MYYIIVLYNNILFFEHSIEYVCIIHNNMEYVCMIHNNTEYVCIIHNNMEYVCIMPRNRNVSWCHVAESQDIQDYGELIKFINSYNVISMLTFN